MKWKECFKCHTAYPLDQFYKHPRMADGRLNKCKQCTKRDAKSNRDKNLDYYRAYDRWRFQHVEERRRSALERAKKYDHGPYQRAHRVRRPEARDAQKMVHRALKSGRLKKPGYCSRCGEWFPSRLIHGHHEDYARPLDVEWICHWCHCAHHRKPIEWVSKKRL